MTDTSVGNLSFDHYTLETDAEKNLVSLEASLLVAGYHPSSDTIRILHKLKRSMKRNRVRRYSFSVHPVVVTSKQSTPPSAELCSDTEELFLVRDIVEKCTGFGVKSYKNKVTSSGHNLTTFVLAGPCVDLLFDPDSPLLREHLASSVLEHTKSSLSSFCVGSTSISKKGDMVGVKVQCVYRK